MIEIVKIYQCSGCINGSDTECGKFEQEPEGISCINHITGTLIGPAMIRVFLGLPTGFNRIQTKKTVITIYETFFQKDKNWNYDIFNVPVWKYLNKEGHTIVRGYMPRNDIGFIHIILEDCINKINCLEITEKDLETMD